MTLLSVVLLVSKIANTLTVCFDETRVSFLSAEGQGYEIRILIIIQLISKESFNTVLQMRKKCNFRPGVSAYLCFCDNYLKKL